MSGRKGSSSKITLGMLKGKSITTSVPTFAIRFHAEDEELEEIYPSAEETDDEAEKQEDDSNCSKGSSQMPCTNVQAPVTTSTSATTSTIHSRDPSPMKEYLKGFGKRSTSVDAGMIDGGSPAASSDTWRIFHEIKGKIAKTVEEKFGEIKSDRRSSTLAFSGGSNIRGGRLVGGGGSKDDSSINSDSEDISESSNKGQDSKSTRKNGNATKRNENAEKSPKKVNYNIKDNDLEVPSTSQEGSNLSAPATPKKTLSTASGQYTSEPQTENDVEHQETDFKEEVEPGVEVNEEMNLSAIEQEEIDEDVPTIDYRQPIPEYSPPLHKKKKKSLFHNLKKHWGAKLFPFIGIFIYYMIPLPPYISGFFSGILISLGIGVVYTKISKISAALTAPIDSSEGGLQVDRDFKIPDYTKLPILEIPPVKEHHQIYKYHGWMNEYRREYNPDTYHLADTTSVYVRLEGTSLRISHTKLRIPKRSMWNERPHRLKFYRQRIYSLENCKLKLLPEGLTRKRVWSKKYPICIVLTPTSKINLDDSLSQMEDEYSKLEDPVSQDTTGELLDPLSEVAHDDDDTENQVSEVKDIITPNVAIDDSDDETFCHINKYDLMEKCLYLFARTDREKEDWYRKLAAVMRPKQSPDVFEEDNFSYASEAHTPAHTPALSHCSSAENLEESADVSTNGGVPPVVPPAPVITIPTNDYMLIKTFEARDFKYLRFMAKFQEVHRYKMFQFIEKKICAAQRYPTNAPKPDAKKRQEQVETAIEEIQEITADVMWINAMVGRVLFDVLQNPMWLEKLQERLQRKLSTIKLPYFIEALVITELDLGQNVPMAHRVSHPRLNERGLWIDIDVTYEGTSCFTLETKLNLLKVKQVGGEIAAAQAAPKEETRGKSPMYDSDLDDSPESSDDEDLNEKSTSGEEKATPSSGSSGKKFINVVNKIAASKYFQQATEYKYIKKAMEGVSNTKLILTVEVNGLIGTLAVNIPPPPSDRLWFGFRGNPRLWLQARPKLGERQVNISQVTSWIEKQLCLEFQKKFVLPNMDDLVIPPMTTDLPD